MFYDIDEQLRIECAEWSLISTETAALTSCDIQFEFFDYDYYGPNHSVFLERLRILDHGMVAA